jgi:triacylglycerol lipase
MGLLWVALMTTTAATALCKDHVILLHGLCRTTRSMETLDATLQKEGYSVSNVGYPSRTATIEALSESVVGGALSNLTFDVGSKVHFVGHSLGGILVRSYLERHSVSNLGRVVMLGPPNQGSEVVDRIGSWRLAQWLNGPAGSQLGTGSDSVTNQLGPVRCELGVIAGDRTLNWINSMMIPGSDDGKVSLERTKVEGMTDYVVVHVTHPYLMEREVAIRQIVSFLKTGRFIHE